MAVKIVRQVKNIVLLGAPASVAGMAAGPEGAPAALRAAGLVDRLTRAGFQVSDQGDCAARVHKADDEHPKARNVAEAVAVLEELRPKIEVAVKSGALPLILGGDDTVVLAAIAGARRYYRHVSLISVDRDAGLNVPASTPSGCLDGMLISHIVGRGAPELVRFWGEPPLIREPNVAIFGIDRIDEPEQKWLVRSPLQHYLAVDIKKRGASAAAQETLNRVHGSRHEYVLLLDLDVIASEDFPATNLPGAGGLSLDEVRQALRVFAREMPLAAFVVAGYNPAKDADGKAAKAVVELLADVLAPRLEEPAPQAAETAAAGPAEAPPEETPQPKGPIQPQVEEVMLVTPDIVAESAPRDSGQSAESNSPEKPSDELPEGKSPTE